MNHDLTDAEWDAIVAMRTAHAIMGGPPPVPYDISGMAAEIVRLRAAVEAHRASWVRANGDGNIEGNARPDDLALWASLNPDSAR